MTKNKKESGITLISLVVTIIVLLILLAVSVAMLTGKNGILKTSKKAKIESQKAEYKEAIELAKTEDNITKERDRSKTERLDGIYEIISENSKFSNDIKNGKATIEKIYDDGLEPRIIIITKEGWKYTVTVDEIIEGDIPPIDLENADIKIEIEPKEWTNKYVEVVSIKVENEEYKDNKIQYSFDTKTWKDYESTEKIKITENKKIYARLVSKLSISDKYATVNITNIDKDEPQITNVEEKLNSIRIVASDSTSGISSCTMQINGTTVEVDIPKDCKEFDTTIDKEPSPVEITVTDKAGNATTYSGHTYSAGEYTVDKEPTCEETGEKSIYCTDCGALIPGSTVTIPAKGHKSVSSNNAVAATCITAGKQSDTKCSVCNKTLSVGATIAALGHTGDNVGSTIKAATCTAAGSRYKKCTRCGANYGSVTLSALGHKYSSTAILKPSARSSGDFTIKTTQACYFKFYLSKPGYVVVNGARANYTAAGTYSWYINAAGTFRVIVTIQTNGIIDSYTTYLNKCTRCSDSYVSYK